MANFVQYKFIRSLRPLCEMEIKQNRMLSISKKLHLDSTVAYLVRSRQVPLLTQLDWDGPHTV